MISLHKGSQRESARHTFTCDSILISVTDLLGLDTEKVPLPSTEHLHGGKDETLQRNVSRRFGDVKHPDKSDDDVGYHGHIVIL